MKTNSRGPLLDMQRCAANVGGNRFNLVLIAATRARELAKQIRNSTVLNKFQPAVTALQEIEAGTIGKEYLRKV